MRHTLKLVLPALKGEVAVAVSGGPDSMALALLLQQAGYAPQALIVDHGLRAESAAEAKQVKQWLADQTIPATILRIRTRPPKTGLMEWARTERYKLLTRYCAQHGIQHLCVAHHQDDQIETFFLNLERGSGLKGLAGMKAQSPLADVTLHRPLLNYTKQELIAYLKSQHVPFFKDPTNKNPVFKRNRVRLTFTKLFKENVELPGRIAGAMRHLAEAEDFIAQQEAQAFDALCNNTKQGLAFDEAALLTLHPLLQFRVFNRMLCVLSLKSMPPRAESVATLLARMAAEKAFTLHGVLGRKTKGIWLLKKEK